MALSDALHELSGLCPIGRAGCCRHVCRGTWKETKRMFVVLCVGGRFSFMQGYFLPGGWRGEFSGCAVGLRSLAARLNLTCYRRRIEPACRVNMRQSRQGLGPEMDGWYPTMNAVSSLAPGRRGSVNIFLLGDPNSKRITTRV